MAPSREIDFNDTSYMADVFVPDSHLHTGRDRASWLSPALHCKAKQHKAQPVSQLAMQHLISYKTRIWSINKQIQGLANEKPTLSSSNNLIS